MKKTLQIILFLILLQSSKLQAQKYYTDLEMWNSIGINYSPVSKLNLAYSSEFRINNNVSNFRKNLNDISLTYKVHKQIKFTIGGRFNIINRINNYYRNEYMYYLDLQLQQKINRFTLNLRNRIQHTQSFDLPLKNYPENALRNKLTINYDIYKTSFTPYISYEWFSLFEKKTLFSSKYRTIIGLSNKFLFSHKISIFYGLQSTVFYTLNEKNILFGILYEYEID